MEPYHNYVESPVPMDRDLPRRLSKLVGLDASTLRVYRRGAAHIPDRQLLRMVSCIESVDIAKDILDIVTLNEYFFTRKILEEPYTASEKREHEWITFESFRTSNVWDVSSDLNQAATLAAIARITKAALTCRYRYGNARPYQYAMSLTQDLERLGSNLRSRNQYHQIRLGELPNMRVNFRKMGGF